MDMQQFYPADRAEGKKYGKDQAGELVRQLFEDSMFFAVTPFPYDIYAIEVRPGEESALPEPVGYGGMVFDDWIAVVERQHDGGLTPEGRGEFFDYFLRGLSADEAIRQDQIDLGDADDDDASPSAG